MASPMLEGIAFDDFNGHHDADRVLKRGVSAAQSGDRDLARKLLTQVVALDPDCEDAWMWLASISDYPEELLAFLNRVLNINPENTRAAEWRSATMSLLARTFVKRAVAAHNDGNEQLATQCIEQALSHDDNCEDAWAWKASIAENDDEQIECLNRVLEINPDNAEVSAALHEIEERRADALRKIKEQRIAALFDDAKAAALAGDNANALDLVGQYLDVQPSNAEAWVLRSHLSQSVEEQLSSLDHALEADPNHAAARSAHDFLISIATPKAEHVEELVTEVEANVELDADKGSTDVAYKLEADFEAAGSSNFGAPSEEEIAVAHAVTEEIPEVQQFFSDAAETIDFEQPDDEPDQNYDPYQTIDLSGSQAADVQQVFEVVEILDGEPFHAEAQQLLSLVHECPFCGRDNEGQAFECSGCHAVLTLSDIESLLAENGADHDKISHAVIRMEGEWNAREFNVDELVALGVGHFNLGSYAAGFKYLQEAARIDPNNVVLTGQVNALAIRINEIDRQREVDDARPKGKTILVVDDSATIRKLISGKLEKSGHHVICASDGVEALERLAGQRPDLVLLDITMPRMDGYEVCKQIRSNPECKDLPVVMISGKDGFFDKVRGRMAGTTGYVTKPFGPETLMKALETYLLVDAEVAEFKTEPELEPAV
jgi:CheY-like chemotaxis protein